MKKERRRGGGAKEGRGAGGREGVEGRGLDPIFPFKGTPLQTSH
jgi:hypothetical protein